MSMIDVTRLSPVMRSRKLQVYEFICAFFAMHGVGPTLSEMMAGCGDCAKSRVQDAIRKLEREQKVHRVPGKARGVTPILPHDQALQLLRAQGWLIDADLQIASPPDMVLLDIDESGALVIRNSSGPKAGLPQTRARAHDAHGRRGRGRQGSGCGEGEEEQGERRGDAGDTVAAA